VGIVVAVLPIVRPSSKAPSVFRWTQELRRFASVFRLYQSTKENREVFYVAGNHDYGFGDGVVAGAYTRFIEYLGDPNWAIQIANHTLIAIDTLSLSGSGDTVPKQAAESFLHGIDACMLLRVLVRLSIFGLSDALYLVRPKLHNRILFTHVPLWRPDDASCGTLRGSRPMKQGSGHQYQNFLTKQISQAVIRRVEPDVAVFSGDDHDYCMYTHHQGPNSYPEVSGWQHFLCLFLF